jgi:hypothetical protein
MPRTLTTTALTIAAVLTFGEAASATEVNIRITTAERGFSHVGSYDRDHYRGDIQCIRAPCYPARERPRWDRGDHWDRGHGWGRPVVVRRGGWGRHDDDCRTIVKRQVNHWGEMVIERTKVCY